MKTDDFDFELPLELIAQSPILKRDESKLLVMDRKTGEIKHEQLQRFLSDLRNCSCPLFSYTEIFITILFRINFVRLFF